MKYNMADVYQTVDGSLGQLVMYVCQIIDCLQCHYFQTSISLLWWPGPSSNIILYLVTVSSSCCLFMSMSNNVCQTQTNFCNNTMLVCFAWVNSSLPTAQPWHTSKVWCWYYYNISAPTLALSVRVNREKYNK